MPQTNATDRTPALKALSPISGPAAKGYSPLLTVAQSLLATAALVAVVGGATYLTAGPAFWPQPQSGDIVGESQKQERLRAFSALGTVELTPVPDVDLGTAVDSMQLSASAKQALLADAAPPSQAPAVPAPAAPQSAQTDTPASAPAAQPAASPVPAAEAVPRKAPAVRLAWIVLWDTDAEDGDAVRIDSQGYSRTVVLTKLPATFAIPIPAGGVVNITGVRDGEGGGITVGLGSGAAKAVFPIMSVGQSLGLRVKVN